MTKLRKTVKKQREELPEGEKQMLSEQA